ncbi:MAG: hypothetical protein QOK44_5289 [Betaproteobacteria bacterium]|nr:hypothetical protein [Betaproteobacteria bacterium]
MDLRAWPKRISAMSPAHQNIRGQSDRLVEQPPDGGFPADLLRQNRRRALGLLGAITLTPLLRASSAHAAVAPANLSFRALRKGSPIGVHTVTFRQDGERLVVTTHIDISVKVLLFTAFYLKHDAEEVWQSGRLAAVKSTTDDNGMRLRVSGSAADGGFRIIGDEGPFLAPAQLLTSNMLWDVRMLREDRLLDVQYGGVIGLAVKPLGEALVDTPGGQVRANRHHLITPHYAGTLFHDGDGRWVKALIEAKGEIIEYALAI